LLAVALTPHILGAWTLALATVFPRADRSAFLVAPLVVSCFVILRLGPRTVSVVRERLRRMPAGWMAAGAMIVLMLLLMGFKAMEAARMMLVTHDASVYLSEAHAFARSPSLDAIPTYEAERGSLVRIHPHSFLFEAYLAQADMSVPPSDAVDAFTPKFAIQLTFLYAALAVWGLSVAACPGWASALAVPVLLSVPLVGSLVFLHSRDGFRIVPFVALCALLLTIIGRNRKPSLSLYVAVAVLVGLAIASHTLNLTFLAALWIALIPFWLTGALLSSVLARLTLAAAIGAVLPCIDYLRSLYLYGSPLGLGMNYFFYGGTPLEAWFRSSMYWTADIGIVDALALYAEQHGAVATGLTVSVAVAGLFLVGKSGLRWRVLSLFFLAIFALPLLIAAGTVSTRGALLSNPRYASLVYFVGAALIPLGVAHGIKKAALARKFVTTRAMGRARVVPAVICLFAAGLAGYQMSLWFPATASWFDAVAKEYAFSTQIIRERVGADAVWITDDYRLTYRISPVPVYLFSKQGAPVMQARSVEEAERALVAMKACVFVLLKPDKSQAEMGWFDDMAFVKAVQALPGTKSYDNGRSIVSIVGSELYLRRGLPNPCTQNAER
jgi:hypothetical protein